MPLFRFPIHLSYILYIATFSEWFAVQYFRAALALCRVMDLSPSILLHPLDFLGKDDDVGLEFFPAMSLSSAEKLKVVDHAMAIYRRHFHVVTMEEHAVATAESLEPNLVEQRPPDPAPCLRTDL